MSDIGFRFPDHYYQTDQVILLPYFDHRGAFPEDFLVHLYSQMMEDGLLETVFAGMSRVTLNKFVVYLSSHPTVIYIEKPGNVVGFGWVAQSEGIDGARKASFGFTFFRKYWATKRVRDLCWFSLRWWFTELKVDVLYATSLRSNRLATNFSRIFGFNRIGDLPMFFQKGDSLVDGTLICLKRYDFDPLYEQWYEGVKECGIEAVTVLTS